MKKITYKSASATRKTSSPSGTSGLTDTTANGKKATKKSWKHSYVFAPSTALPTLQIVAERFKKMSPEEFRVLSEGRYHRHKRQAHRALPAPAPEEKEVT